MDPAFGASEFADKPEPRCPCLRLLDTSASTDGPAMAELLRGLAASKHDLALDSLETDLPPALAPTEWHRRAADGAGTASRRGG